MRNRCTVDANFWLTLRAQPVKWIPVAKAELFGTTKFGCHRSHNLKPCLAAIMLLVWGGDKYRLVRRTEAGPSPVQGRLSCRNRNHPNPIHHPFHYETVRLCLPLQALFFERYSCDVSFCSKAIASISPHLRLTDDAHLPWILLNEMPSD